MMKMIVINHDGSIKNKDQVTIHINYNEALTLKELSEVLDLTNKAINDINRENGIKNNGIKEYAAEVSGVESGSIVIHILTSFVVPLATSLLADFLYERLKNIGAKKEKNKVVSGTAYPITINVNGDSNTIELNISK